MDLSNNLISKFIEVTLPRETKNTGSVMYGTVEKRNDEVMVKLDGSELLTPVSTTADVVNKERVMVMIQNHTATIVGNASSPSARSDDVNELKEIVADKVSTSDLEAERARINVLEADNVTINQTLTAYDADIKQLTADNVVINQTLTAQSADISSLKTDKADVKTLEAEKARIDSLEADNVTINQTLTAQSADISSLKTDKADIKTLEAEKARIDSLEADNVTINKTLTAQSADISSLKTDKADVKTLEAEKARIDSLEADNVTINQTLTAQSADISSLKTDKADIKTLEAEKARIDSLEADNVTINKTLTAQSADISSLKTDKLDAEEAELKYANIDFSNIGEAAMKYLYSESGLIKDIVIDHGSITGELVGVTISGDLIKGNTIVADKLVVKGEDGLYYKLNTDGNTVEKEQTDYNSLNGSVIKAKSITATKIAVDDLVAFGATIGGFHISKDTIFSGVKESVLNTTRGIYLDNSGQISFGDSANYIRYFKEQNGKFKLDIAVESLSIKSSDGIDVDISDTIDEIKNDIDTVRDEITTLLRIESSRGTVFKNNAISTVLSVVVYHGKDRITDIDKLHEVYGNTAYIQWKWQRLDEETYGIISSADSRMSNGGFSFTLSPDDVDTKVTFMCELITD